WPAKSVQNETARNRKGPVQEQAAYKFSRALPVQTPQGFEECCGPGGSFRRSARSACLMFDYREWQPNHRRGRRAGGGLEFEQAAVGGHNPSRDAQSEPATFHRVAVAGVSAKERIKHARQCFRRNSWPGVTNR